MTKSRAPRARMPRSPKPGSALERLTARLLLSEVSFEFVADDVEQALRSLDLDDLGSRAGRHRGGYTSPTEATWELLQEAVDPYLSDMKRQMELGLEMEALEICKGVVLGLYRIRGTRGDESLLTPCVSWPGATRRGADEHGAPGRTSKRSS